MVLLIRNAPFEAAGIFKFSFEVKKMSAAPSPERMDTEPAVVNEALHLPVHFKA